MRHQAGEAIRKASAAMARERTYNEGINWLAQNTDNAAIGDAIRLLAYLTDTTEEWVWQAVAHQQDAIAANDRKTEEHRLGATLWRHPESHCVYP